VVGLSESVFVQLGVAEYLATVGYRIIPVNPNESEVLGEKCYPDLDSVGERSISGFFRRPSTCRRSWRRHPPPAKLVWMQESVVHEAAARRAEAAGLAVVMDRCILKDHRRLLCTS